MRALSVLSLKDNRLLPHGKILSEMVATNTMLKELDLSSNTWMNDYGEHQGDGPGFAQELTVGIRDNRALSVLNLASNSIGKVVLPDGWKQTDYTEWTHSDGSKVAANPGGKPKGVVALANAIPDMGALTKLDISNQVDMFGNGGLGAEGAKYLAGALKDHP
jgi:hypothetical protein